jgi:hypothetical protein
MLAAFLRLTLVAAVAGATIAAAAAPTATVKGDEPVEQRRALLLDQIRSLELELQAMPPSSSAADAAPAAPWNEAASSSANQARVDALFDASFRARARALEEEEEKLTFSQERVLIFAAVVVVSLIVAISVAFEKMQEWLEDHIMEVLEPVLKSIFGELTILGFIGLIMFFVTKFGKHGLDVAVCNDESGWFKENHETCPRNETNEDQWSGECPENPLIELTETAHMILFFVMVLFLIQSIMLILMGMSHIRAWKRYEDLCVTHTMPRALVEQRKAHVAYERDAGACAKKCGYYYVFCSCLSKHSRGHALRADFIEKTEFLRYHALRTAFIKSYNTNAIEKGNNDHNLEGDFDFAEYSVKVLAEKLGEIVELTPENWMVIWVIFVGFLAVDFVGIVYETHTMLLIGVAIGACYLSCLAIIAAEAKAHKIRERLVHPLHLNDGHELRVAVEHARSGFSSAMAARVAGGKWMRKTGVGRQEKKNKDDTTSLNAPLLAPGTGGERKEGGPGPDDVHVVLESKAKALQSLGENDAEKKKQLRTQIRLELLKSAGVAHTQMHDDDHEPLYKYHLDGTKRPEPDESALCHCLCRHAPTHQEALFWGGENGVELFFGYIRTQMVLVSLYLGTFCVIFAKAVIEFWSPEEDEEGGGGDAPSPSSVNGSAGNFYENDHHVSDHGDPALWQWLGPTLVFLVAFFPLTFMLYELSDLIPLVIRITTTEEMINGKCVLQTLRIMKSRRALRALHNISCFMADVDKVADQCRKQALSSSTFSMLTDDEQEALMKDCMMHNYTAGHKIIEQGQVNGSLYIISEGTADVIVDGLKVASLTEGKEFGEISMLKGHKCNASIVVGKRCKRFICFTLDKAGFEKHLRGKNKMRELMVEAENEEKPSEPKAGPGAFFNSGRRESVQRITAMHQRANSITTVKKRNSITSGSYANGSVPGSIQAEGAAEAASKTPEAIAARLAAEEESDGLVPKWIGEGKMVDTTGDGVPDTMGYDTNGDGKINAYMVDTTGDGKADALGFDEDGDGVIDTLDIDLDGVPDIRAGSLADVIRKNRSAEALEQQRKIALTDLFHAIDSGGDGSIEEEELIEFLSKIFPPSENKAMQEKQIKLMIEGLDADGDGEVSLSEFLQMMEVGCLLVECVLFVCLLCTHVFFNYYSLFAPPRFLRCCTPTLPLPPSVIFKTTSLLSSAARMKRHQKKSRNACSRCSTTITREPSPQGSSSTCSERLVWTCRMKKSVSFLESTMRATMGALTWRNSRR